jgi:hypothetical protein
MVTQSKDANSITAYLQRSRRSQSLMEDDWREHLKVLETRSNERTLKHNAWNKVHMRERDGCRRPDHDLAWTEAETAVARYILNQPNQT